MEWSKIQPEPPALEAGSAGVPPAFLPKKGRRAEGQARRLRSQPSRSVGRIQPAGALATIDPGDGISGYDSAAGSGRPGNSFPGGGGRGCPLAYLRRVARLRAPGPAERRVTGATEDPAPEELFNAKGLPLFSRAITLLRKGKRAYAQPAGDSGFPGTRAEELGCLPLCSGTMAVGQGQAPSPEGDITWVDPWGRARRRCSWRRPDASSTPARSVSSVCYRFLRSIWSVRLCCSSSSSSRGKRRSGVAGPVSVYDPARIRARPVVRNRRGQDEQGAGSGAGREPGLTQRSRTN